MGVDRLFQSIIVDFDTELKCFKRSTVLSFAWEEGGVEHSILWGWANDLLAKIFSCNP